MSRHIKFDRMFGRLKRCAEVAQDPDVSKSVKRLHDDVVAPKATAFCSAHEAVGEAQAAVARARRQKEQQLAAFDSRYRMTRSLVLAYDPDMNLPETLKVQPMDTAKLEAISGLMSIVQSHAGEPWADELLADSFGTLAPKAKTALEEFIGAIKALWVAQRARADAYEPAYTAYLAFKRVVRDDMGSSSVHYRRLHIRPAPSPVARDEQAEQAAPDSAVVPSVKGGSMATGEPKPVKVA